MWNPIKYFRLKRDWRLVSTLEAYYNYSDTKQKDEVIYYLYENGLGKRTCDHEGTGLVSGQLRYITKKRETHPYYLKKIRPWLAGRYDPDIPSYETIKTKEFKDKLTGRIT